MIADTHNKVSASGSNLSERLENLLTGNVFGTLRYLEFEDGFSRLLSHAAFVGTEVQHKWDNAISKCSWRNTEVKFWERMDGKEIDFVIHGPDDLLVGCEVKYRSWLSSDDDVEFAETTGKDVAGESINQLAEYGRRLEQRSNNSFLLLIAPKDKGHYIVSNALRRKILPVSVPLGLLLWEDIYNVATFEHVSATSHPKRFLFGDMSTLLARKNFQTFSGWDTCSHVTDAAYVFRNETKLFDWPTALVKGEMTYVFRT